MNSEIKKSRIVKVRDLLIGGDAPVSIQSMTNRPIEDVAGTIAQIERLEKNGAQLVRLALRDENAIPYLKEIRHATKMLLVADIHFDYRLAISAIECGIDKVRINPGNIGGKDRVTEVVKAARDYAVPIRIGVNGGSLDSKRYPHVTPEALVESADEHIVILEDLGFSDIVVSIKSSDVSTTINANRLFAEKFDYPLHIGLTEAGYGLNCIVQSSVALGHLLLEGIGNTIRVSMTGEPDDEPVVARKILESVGLRKPVIQLISCPTCGRTSPELDILGLAKSVDDALQQHFGPVLAKKGQTLTVAVMGCEVNGPGEARHADLGVAGGRHGCMILFKKGVILRKIDVTEVVAALLETAEELLNN